MPSAKRGLNPAVLVAAACVSLGAAYLASGHVGLDLGAPESGEAVADEGALEGLRVTGPYLHENLGVYLIHGADQIEGETFLTLQEALASGQAVLHETGQVGELEIENLSGESFVFAQSGDLVKGGRQDRVIAHDRVLPPRSGRVGLTTYCVESGRWRKRGDEQDKVFSGSEDQVAFRELKLAAQLHGSQTQVWDQVDRAQEKLGGSVGRSVRSARSSTSLQLSLEDEVVRTAVAAYQHRLGRLIDSQEDVVGLAVVINGRFNNSELYASPVLFRKLWPKLLRAAATEAVAELPGWEHQGPPTAGEVLARMQAARSAQARRRAVGDGLSVDVGEGERDVVFKSSQQLHGHRSMKDFAEVHSSVVAK